MKDVALLNKKRNRADKRADLREMQKRISKMTPAEFENFLASMAHQYEVEHVNRIEKIYLGVLNAHFGFGQKRLLRLQEEAQKVYDETRWSDGL